MRLGLIGGSFDPVHAGHVAMARAARTGLALDRVLFLPTAQPPHKPDRRMASALARYTMVELALLGEEGLFASPIEWTPGQPAYTADTVDRFRAEFPQTRLFLIIGADSFAELPTWVRWRDLVGAVDLAVIPRPGWNEAELAAGAPEPLRDAMVAGRVHFLAATPLPWSSTALRGQLARGEAPPPGALPPLVLDYVRKYQLYR
ncbi:MAG: nicotinate (nicotinamide) nucleotide adenylyltransferase [Thermoanaerobaculia bacterium]|nr:nicotinate (nicotinamide) nucleotide adenylyltransferase [Thermoanaerobaculia bacterium]MCZ7649910.1 nicotinate (nicotinamide) nucleotide adenylyltransferase [Thermoanaerobaculia bacterium]